MLPENTTFTCTPLDGAPLPKNTEEMEALCELFEENGRTIQFRGFFYQLHRVVYSDSLAYYHAVSQRLKHHTVTGSTEFQNQQFWDSIKGRVFPEGGSEIS